jgi:hypothetical protein
MTNESPQDATRSKRAVVSLDARQWDQLRALAEAETGMDLSGDRFSRLQDAVTKVVSRQSVGTPIEKVLANARSRTNE